MQWHGHLKRECPSYLKGKGKVLTTTLSDSKSSISGLEDSCDGDGNYMPLWQSPWWTLREN